MSNEKHARLSPSNNRWVFCPGSVREESHYPNISGHAAIDGTGSHLLLEKCLNENCNADHFINETIGVGNDEKTKGWVINKDRASRVQICLDYIENRKNELLNFEEFKNFPSLKVKIESETKTDPGNRFFNRNDWWGTVDVTLTLTSTDFSGQETILFIEIIDFKDGSLWVNQNNNSQLISYIGGKLPLNISSILKTRMTIVQPKTNPSVRFTKDLTMNEVIEELMKLNEAAEKTDNKNAPLIPDNEGGKGYCKWCKHRNNCEERLLSHNNIDESIIIKISESKGHFKNYDNETLSQMLDAKPRIEDILKKIEQEVEKRIENGGDIPNYKLLPGNNKKEWNIEEDELVKKLRFYKLKKEDIYATKILTPVKLMSSYKLSEEQKEKINKKFVKISEGKLKVKRMSNQNKEIQVVNSFQEIIDKENKISFL